MVKRDLQRHKKPIMGIVFAGSTGKPVLEAKASTPWWAFCMEKLTNKKSGHLHLGKRGELLAKSKFIEYGFDVFSTEVDDKGIDFIVKNEKGEYFEIQVKATNKNYVFMKKDIFPLKKGVYLALIIFDNGIPSFYLIPSLEWEKTEDKLFLTDKNYEGKKSPPEYGVYTSDKHIPKIKELYSFEEIIKQLKN